MKSNYNKEKKMRNLVEDISSATTHYGATVLLNTAAPTPVHEKFIQKFIMHW